MKVNALGQRCPLRRRSSPLRYRVEYGVHPGVSKPSKNAAAKSEAVRLHRLREDAQRPMSVNLAEGIALSHKLMRFVGSARLH